MELTPIFVTGIIFLAIYKTIELFVRRKERLMIIDKLSAENAPALNLSTVSELFKSNTPNSFGPLRWGCLAVGLGFGLLIFSIMYVVLEMNHYQLSWIIRDTLASSLTLLCGGAGLIAAYVMEKSSKKNNSAVSGEA